VCEFFGKVFLAVSKKPTSMADLCDGEVMFEALSEISMDHFDPTSIGRDLGDNWALKASNLKKLLRNLEDYYHEVLNKDADFESLSSQSNDIAKGEDLNGLMEFVELIAVAATTGEDNDIFVPRIKEMSPEALGDMQLMLQEAMSIITEYDADGSEGEDDADSIMFEGEEGGGGTSEVLFPSHSGDEELLKERDELRQALQDAKRELGQVKSQTAIDMEDAQKDKDKLRAINQDLQERLKRREEDLTEAEQTASKKSRALDEAEAELGDLKENSDSLADELDIEKAKVLQLRKKEAMVEVYRKKLDALETSNSQGGGMDAQTANHVEQIMKLETENMKIAPLQRDLDEIQSKAKKLESRIQEQEDDMKAKDAEISQLKSDAASAEKAKKMFEDDLNELRAQHEGAVDAALALNGASEPNESRLQSENAKLRAQMEQMKLSGAAAVSTKDGGKVAELQEKLDSKNEEVTKLVNEKEKLEAYTKKTLQKFQEKYLVALQDCKAKLREKHEKIEALESRSSNEKAAQKREEKLISSAIYELGLGHLSSTSRSLTPKHTPKRN